MIISHVIGGLGNQMFQYAAGRALSLKLDMPYKIDLTNFANYKLHNGFELHKIFQCNTPIAEKNDIVSILHWQAYPLINKITAKFKYLRAKQLIREPHFHYWSDFNLISASSYLQGYWQSEKYFLQYATEIRKDFEFNTVLANKNLYLSKQIASSNSVSLHIRRGDYINNKKNSAIFKECNVQYYNIAINIIKKYIHDVHFYIFSDDLDWVKSKLILSDPHTYVEHNTGADSYMDMHLMSLCKHNIMANSSFSWWGAWLNSNPDKIIIMPKNWFFPQNMHTKDLFFSKCILINNE